MRNASRPRPSPSPADTWLTAFIVNQANCRTRSDTPGPLEPMSVEGTPTCCEGRKVRSRSQGLHAHIAVWGAFEGDAHIPCACFATSYTLCASGLVQNGSLGTNGFSEGMAEAEKPAPLRPHRHEQITAFELWRAAPPIPSNRSGLSFAIPLQKIMVRPGCQPASEAR
jgi:hypothetical protein